MNTIPLRSRYLSHLAEDIPTLIEGVISEAMRLLNETASTLPTPRERRRGAAAVELLWVRREAVARVFVRSLLKHSKDMARDQAAGQAPPLDGSHAKLHAIPTTDAQDGEMNPPFADVLRTIKAGIEEPLAEYESLAAFLFDKVGTGDPAPLCLEACIQAVHAALEWSRLPPGYGVRLHMRKVGCDALVAPLRDFYAAQSRLLRRLGRVPLWDAPAWQDTRVEPTHCGSQESALERQIRERLLGKVVPLDLERFLVGPWLQVLTELARTHAPSAPVSQRMLQCTSDLINRFSATHAWQSVDICLAMNGDALLETIQYGLRLASFPAQRVDAVVAALSDLLDAQTTTALESADVAAPCEQARRAALASQSGAALHNGTDNAPETWVDELLPGQWLRIFLKSQWMAMQLQWRSDNGHFFLFSSQRAGGTHSMTRRALVRLREQAHMDRIEFVGTAPSLREPRPLPTMARPSIHHPVARPG